MISMMYWWLLCKQPTGECAAMCIGTHNKNANYDSQICPMLADEHKTDELHTTDASSASTTSKDAQPLEVYNLDKMENYHHLSSMKTMLDVSC